MAIAIQLFFASNEPLCKFFEFFFLLFYDPHLNIQYGVIIVKNILYNFVCYLNLKALYLKNMYG